MKIKLHFPEESIDEIKSMGLRQQPVETLRLVTDHPMSSHNIGVLLRGKSGEILDGNTFVALVKKWNAWIEVDSDKTADRVHKALVTLVTDCRDSVRVTLNEQ